MNFFTEREIGPKLGDSFKIYQYFLLVIKFSGFWLYKIRISMHLIIVYYAYFRWESTVLSCCVCVIGISFCESFLSCCCSIVLLSLLILLVFSPLLLLLSCALIVKRVFSFPLNEEQLVSVISWDWFHWKVSNCQSQPKLSYLLLNVELVASLFC